MKKIIFLMMLLAIGTIGCSSMADHVGKNGKGDASEYEWTIELSQNIVKIENYLSMDIEYREGPGRVTITGPEKMVNSIRIRTYGAKIDFTLKPGVHSADLSKVKCVISLPTINEVSIHGSGDFSAKDITSVIFNVNILGSGDLSINSIEATSVKFLLRGSGDMKIGSVMCSTVQFLTQGSGDITVKTLSSTSTQAILQGSGDTSLLIL